MKRSLPRFTLGSMFLLILAVAVIIAWRVNRAHLKRELVNTQTRLTAAELLANDRGGVAQVSSGYGRGATPAADLVRYATPQAFVETLRVTKDWYELRDILEAFVVTSTADAAIPQLIACLEDPNPEVRWRTLATMGRMPRHAETLVPAIIPLLDDPHMNVRWHAANALGAFESNAVASLPTLQRIFETESSAIAAYAAGMAVKIDPTVDIQPRLQEFLRSDDADTRERRVEALEHIVRQRWTTVEKATEDALLEAFRLSEDESSKRRSLNCLNGLTTHRLACPLVRKQL